MIFLNDAKVYILFEHNNTLHETLIKKADIK